MSSETAIITAVDEEQLDVVWGAAEIGRIVRLPTRKAFYCLEKGYLPGKKFGRLWMSSRKALVATVTLEKPAA